MGPVKTEKSLQTRMVKLLISFDRKAEFMNINVVHLAQRSDLLFVLNYYLASREEENSIVENLLLHNKTYVHASNEESN